MGTGFKFIVLQKLRCKTMTIPREALLLQLLGRVHGAAVARVYSPGFGIDWLCAFRVAAQMHSPADMWVWVGTGRLLRPNLNLAYAPRTCSPCHCQCEEGMQTMALTLPMIWREFQLFFCHLRSLNKVFTYLLGAF